jgi:tripartite-type tricarboxylate transporter receptor subunit TctC
VAATPIASLAQPAKAPIKLIVGYAPGGSADAVARMVADKLKDVIGAPVIVDNRPGAGGQLAADYVRAAPADGNTLLVANTHMMAMLPLTTRSAKYDPVKDFAPITRMTSFYEAVAVAANVPATSVSQWLDVVRKDAGAGNFGVPAPGSIAHFLGYQLGRDNKVDLQAIPYKGAAPLVQDLLGGQIRAGILPILDVAQHHPTGKIKVLAVNGSKRAQLLPGVPTLKELGINGFEQLEWTALLAPAGTPKAVVEQLSVAVGKVLALPELQAKLLKLGMESHTSTPDELGRLIADDLSTWGPVVKASGFTAD